jgi:hypothetical protein
MKTADGYVPMETLELAAEVYSRALAEGRWPVVAVTKELGLPRSTVNHYITKARWIGLLPPTTKGIAAGRPVSP